MKISRLFKIIATVTVIGFGLAACGGTENGPTGSTADLGNQTVAIAATGATPQSNIAGGTGFTGAIAWFNGDLFFEKTYDYQFATNNALLVQERLPANSGSNELSGKTFIRNLYAFTFFYGQYLYC